MKNQQIAQYEIQDRLGAGGMGEVWKAFDPKLRRTVAIKILSGSDRHAAGRVLAEARAASALNHPNICTIYEVGEDDSRNFIAMEYVEGRPISESIPSEGLPAEAVVRYGIEIAAALEHAHERGIIHRDLKGANVVLTADGHVKLIDFGIALPLPAGDADAVTRQQTAPLTSGPVGTLGYMAPEVLKGEEATTRSDIWALGVLLYEMASGQQPFSGATQADVVAAIVKESPPPLPAKISPGLRGVIQRSLTKEPGQRYRHASAVEAALEAIQSTSSTAQQTVVVSSGPSRTGWVAAAAALVLVLVLVAAGGYAAGLFSPAKMQLTSPERIAGASVDESNPAWSPDGRMLAYEAGGPNGGPPDIWVVQLGGSPPVNRTADYAGEDSRPAWSPDGTQVAFFSDRDGPGYYVMPTLGGPARRVLDAVPTGQPQWSPDSTELAGVVRIAEGTLAIEIISLQSRATRRIPIDGVAFDLSWSPDGRFFAFADAVSFQAEITQLWLLRVADGALLPMTDRRAAYWTPTWSADSRTLYFVTNREGGMDLWQQRLHEDGAVDGLPARVSHGVGMQRAALSADGTRVAYTRGGRMANLWRVPIRDGRLAAWSDATQLTTDQAFIELAGLSPDGERLFFSSDRSGNQDLWVMPSGGGEMEQLTTDPTPDWAPTISPQGDRIAFYSFRSGNRDLWVMPVNGGRATQLTTDDSDDFQPFWSPDGSQIAFMSARSGKFEIWLVPAAGGQARRLTSRADPEAWAKWTPDGRWIYFNSGDGSSPYVDLWRMPAAGGTVEFVEASSKIVGWSRDGETMYTYEMDEETLRAVPVAGGSARLLTRGPGFLGGGKPGVVLLPSIIADGQYLYFSWREDMGDIWVMDVVGAGAAAARR